MRHVRVMMPQRALREQLVNLGEGLGAMDLDSRLIPLLIVSSQTVSARLAGETVTFAAMRRVPASRAVAVNDQVILEGSLDRLPSSRRRRGLRAQPELRRALAVRGMNAAGVFLASQYVRNCLKTLYEATAFEDFSATTSQRARMAIQPFVSDAVVADTVCEMVSRADAAEHDPSRWKAIVEVAKHLLEHHSYCHQLGSVADAHLASARSAPLSDLRFPALTPLVDLLVADLCDDARAQSIVRMGVAELLRSPPD